MRRSYQLFAFVILLSAGSVIALNAELPELSADNPIEFDHETQEMRAEGNAQLRHGPLLFEADQILMSQKEGKVLSNGNVVITRKYFRAVGDKLDYDIRSEKVITGDYRLGSDPVYAVGDEMQVQGGEIYTEDATLYYGEPDQFSLNMLTKKLWGEPGGMMYARHAWFRLGKIPFFYTPYLAVNTEDKPIEVETEVGTGDNEGVYIRNQVMVRTSEHWAFGGLLDFYGKRGLLFGPAVRYKNLDGDNPIETSLYTGGIRDEGDRNDPGVDRLNRPITRGRWFAEWRYKQHLKEHTDLIGTASIWSDSEAEREFRPDWFNSNQNPDSFLEATYRSDNYLISAFLRARTNSFQRIQQRLPEVSFYYLPQEIKPDTDLYHTFRAEVGHIFEKALPATAQRHLGRLDTYYGLYRPVAVTDWLSITPLTGVRYTHYKNFQGSGNFSRIAGEIGFDLEMKAYGQWDYENKTWRMNGIRHVLKPVIQYRYIPFSTRGSESTLSDIDVSVFDNLMDVVGLNYVRTLDIERKTHIMRMGFQNNFYTRSERKKTKREARLEKLERSYQEKDQAPDNMSSFDGTRSFASFNIYQDIKFSRKPDDDLLSNLFTTVSVSPVPWFSVSNSNRFKTSNLEWKESQLTATVTQPRQWTVSLHTYILKETSHQYRLSGTYHLSPRARINGSLDYNARAGEFTGQSYEFIFRLGHSWEVTVGTYLRKRTRLEDSADYYISARLLSF